MTANVLWLGYDWDGNPFRAAAIFPLYGRHFEDHSEWLGKYFAGVHAIWLAVTIDHERQWADAVIYLFDGEENVGNARGHITPRAWEPFDSGDVTDWTVGPPETTITVHVRG
jgi:hypothetical protein